MSKVDQIKSLLAAGDEAGALRIAARFPHLGEHREVIERAWAAVQHPRFYHEIGQDPDELRRLGVAAVRARCGI